MADLKASFERCIPKGGMSRLLFNLAETGRTVLLCLGLSWAPLACKVESSRFLPTGIVDSGASVEEQETRASSETQGNGSTGHGEGGTTAGGDPGATSDVSGEFGEETSDRSTTDSAGATRADEGQGSTDEDVGLDSVGTLEGEGATTEDIDGHGSAEGSGGGGTGSLETATGDELGSEGEQEDTSGVGDATEEGDAESGSIPDGADWTEKGCGARVRLILEARALTENFETLAVPLTLDGGHLGLSRALADGLGLRVVDPDDGARLALDIEGFDAEGYSWLWLRIDKVEAGHANRYFWLYFDCDAPAGGSAAEVWDTGYEAVWHLNANYVDAGPRELHGYDHGSSRTGGIFAEGRRFWGDDGHGHLGTSAGLRAGASMSVWVNYERLDRANAGDNPLISCGGDTEWSSDNYQYKLSILEDRRLHLFWEYGDGNNVDAYTSSERAPISSDQWHHIAVARDPESQRIYYYVDGVLLGEIQEYGKGPEDGDDSSLWIGAAQSDRSRSFMGLMDEVRISREVFDAKHFRGEVAAMRVLAWQVGEVESR